MRNPFLQFCFLLPALLVVLAAMSPAKLLAGPAVLQVWQEIYARPETPLEKLPSPADNSITDAKVKLGKALFFDVRLSGDEARACASCHDPERGFTDGLQRAAARDGITELANAPSLLNLAWSKHLFWDGRADSLEEQASQPIENVQEMAGVWPVINARLGADPDTADMFRSAFGPEATPLKETVTKALASYVRSLVSPPGKFDRFIGGDKDAFSADERKGFRLFVGKAGCAGCHWGWRFSDDRLHRTGIGSVPIKTPGLRQLSKTAPYMHDGSKMTLEEVIRHYTSLKNDRTLSPNLVRPLDLNSHEIAALVAFLRAL